MTIGEFRKQTANVPDDVPLCLTWLDKEGDMRAEGAVIVVNNESLPDYYFPSGDADTKTPVVLLKADND